MKANRIIALNEELKKFSRKNSLVQEKTYSPGSGSGNGLHSKEKDIVVDDDTFIIEILEFFFDKRLLEQQLTDDLREIAVKCLWTATKASKSLDLIPRPPKGIPSILWLISEGVQIAYRRLKNKGIYKAVKNTVKLKWRSDFEIALIDSQTGEAQSVLTQEMAATNTALVVFIENTGSLPFQWESSVGKIVQEGLEKVVDYISEEFEKWLNKFGDAKGKKYREVIILEDSKATKANLKSTLHDLANREFLIDVFTLAHGNRSSFSAYGGASISGSDLKAMRDSYGKPLPLRVVYMMNCKASGLNDEWLYMGAKAVAGAINNNYIPEPMMTKFWNNWLRGDNFNTAVNDAYKDSVKLINDTIAKVEDFIPLIGGKIKSALESNINPLLVDSKPKIEGNGSITIDTAQIAAAQSYAVSNEFYSKAKYGTGEHVLSGIVNAGAIITPTYALDVNGVKFTYAELIAMGDFFDSYDQMMKSKATELAKLKTLINKSKRYYESKVINKKTTGKNTSDAEWQKATGGRYLKLAEDNFAHFAPSNSTYITSFSSSISNHKREWENYHTRAINIMRSPGATSSDTDDALIVNAFGDHFLTDAFSAGHLFNKNDLSEYFKSLVLNSSGKVNANGNTMFGNIAGKAFRGKLKDAFSKYETVKFKGVVFRPNIHTTDRFKALLIGIMEQEPDILGKTLLAKLVHDVLNDYPGGIPVKDNVGNHWNLTGDGTLDTFNLDVMREAVKQSIENIIDAVNNSNPPGFFHQKVWDKVPRPTAAGATIIKNTIRNYSNPLGNEIVNGADKLLQKNYQALLDELVKRKVLKKA